MTHSLEARNAVITGASQGLGLEIAHAYVAAGANVLLAARNEDLLAQVQTELKREATDRQIIAVRRTNVASAQDVDALAAEAIATFSQVHILVNNAGIQGPKGNVEELDWQAWLQTIETNLFGSVLLCRALLSHFKKHHYGKIVQLSGGGATSPMPRFTAYAVSKAGIVRFAETLAEEVRGDGIDVNAIAPGVLNTRMLDEVLEAGPEKVGQACYERFLAQKRDGGVPLRKAAALAVFLGSAESDGITGKLVSAVWDPWEELQQHREDLKRTDVYTLRRILPKDRGLAWGDDG